MEVSYIAVSATTRAAADRDPIPLGSLAREVEAQLPLAAAQKDLPRGRRQAGWRKELSSALEEASQQIGAVADSEVLAAVQAHRRRPRVLPEVTVVANRSLKTA